MLNDDEAPSSGEKNFKLKSPTLTSYQWSFDMFRISPTAFELFAKIDLIATETPLAEKIFSLKSQTPTSYQWSVDTF
jgi:hypothetical protein